jgi:hypothetical protein
MNYIGREPAPAGLILLGDTTPIGAVGWFHAPPDGSWKQLNGQALLKASYPDLWAYVQPFLTADQVANPGLYKNIDANTFAVPKLDGLFIRAAGVLDANHFSAALGVKQADTVGPHLHDLGNAMNNPGDSVDTTLPGGTPISMTFNGHTRNTGTGIGTENRPANVALIPCVKALRAVLMPAAAMPIPAMELLAEKIAANSAQLDFVGLAGFGAYRFMLTNVVPANNGVHLWARFSVDGGASFDAGNNYVFAASGCDWAGAAYANCNNAGTVAIALAVNVGNIALGGGYCGESILAEPAAAIRASLRMSAWFNSAAGMVHVHGGGVYTVTGSAVNAVRFLFSAGNIASGSIRCYGIQKL